MSRIKRFRLRHANAKPALTLRELKTLLQRRDEYWGILKLVIRKKWPLLAANTCRDIVESFYTKTRIMQNSPWIFHFLSSYPNRIAETVGY
jgi:hypothetical protein